MAQSGFTPIQLYFSTTGAAVPSAGNLANGELAINITDGRLFYKDNSGTVQVLATKAGANGDVVGPASATDNALVRFDNISGKLVQNSVGILDDSGNLSGIAALTTSGALTLNGGTANGVAYLNGSKVLTTGSALTFDGTNFVIGGTAVFGKSTVIQALSGSSAAFAISDNATTTMYANNVSSGVSALWSSGALAFGTNNGVFSEQMRLTSTGLGIGTSSPTQRLDVRGLTRVSSASETTFIGSGSIFSGGSTSASAIRYESGYLAFGYSTTEQMRLDSSGNLGLGVTPSAWTGTFRALQVGSRSAFYQDSGSATALANNIYNDGSNRYIASAAATVFLQESGTFKFFNAPSGTAGNAISFTQAMTLDASGNYLLGTTSSSSVNSGIISTPRAIFYGSGDNVIAKSASAEIGMGPDYLFANTDNALRFGTNNTERARIDSSGNLLVGTDVTTVPTSRSLQWIGPTAGALRVNHSTVNTNGDHFLSFTYNGNVIGSISQSGTTAVAYNTSSDYRLKENIQPMTGALAKVAALKPCTYKWKVDGSDGEGFIAHELQAVVPQCVTGEKDAVDADGKPVYQGIDTSFLVATLTAAIQEQQAIITALTARVAALESN